MPIFVGARPFAAGTCRWKHLPGGKATLWRRSQNGLINLAFFAVSLPKTGDRVAALRLRLCGVLSGNEDVSGRIRAIVEPIGPLHGLSDHGSSRSFFSAFQTRGSAVECTGGCLFSACRGPAEAAVP